MCKKLSIGNEDAILKLCVIFQLVFNLSCSFNIEYMTEDVAGFEARVVENH